MPPLAPARRRQLEYAVRPGTWRHLARRAWWRATPEPSAGAVPLSWPIPGELRTALRVRWPRTYGWPNAGGWIDPIKLGISAHLPLEHADIPQPVGNVVMFETIRGGLSRRVVIDYNDQLALNESAGEADLYFKMQYRRGGYELAHVRPGGYVTKQPALYRYARRWRALNERSAPRVDVLGRFGMNWAQTIRGQAIDTLQAQNRFQFQGGGQAIWWGEYMDELCRARVCIDLPGLGEFCYRLVEYLAVGACVVGPQLDAELPVALESGVHLVRVPRSLDGLVETCERLVGDGEERRRIQRSAADYFDRYLALEQLGAYYLDAIWRLYDEGQPA